MIFYPKGYFNKVSEISFEYLKENGIKGLVLDVDNTLIDYYKNMSEDTVNWVNNLKQNDIKLCILSNSNRKKKVKEVAQKLDLEYTYFGMKPLRRGFKKAKRMLDLPNGEIGVVGDQIFTDILGANIMKMYPILVEPIKERDIFITLIKRPIENYIKKKYKEGLPKEVHKSIKENDSVSIKEKYKIDVKKNDEGRLNDKKVRDSKGEEERDVSE